MEFCEITSRLHFFSSPFQMNFSMPEKCKSVAGENKLLSLSAVKSALPPIL